jgi:hypothetical protein
MKAWKKCVDALELAWSLLLVLVAFLFTTAAVAAGVTEAGRMTPRSAYLNESTHHEARKLVESSQSVMNALWLDTHDLSFGADVPFVTEPLMNIMVKDGRVFIQGKGWSVLAPIRCSGEQRRYVGQFEGCAVDSELAKKFGNVR